MLRSVLYLTIGFTVLPSTVFAQGSDCPMHKQMDAQKAAQTAQVTEAVLPVKVAAAPQISTPRSLTAIAAAPSQAIALERGVEAPYLVTTNKAPKPSSAIVKTAEAPAQMADKNEETKTMTSSLHSPWNDILQSYVSAPDAAGLTHFDYARLKATASDMAKLDAYIESLEDTNPGNLSDNEAIAFWANLYNAVTIQVVTDNYPIKSIRKLGSFNSGPWKKDLVTINGTAMSLDDIEHGTLREKYPSPYIHYMVNCASVGCPNLLNEAWEADTLMAKRKTAAADYINSPRGAVIKGDRLTVSAIYDWFEEDFGGSKEGVLKHLSKYAAGDLAAAIKGGATIKKYDYDWSLNK
ncbi:DUF547 domain-containing protein [Hellea balneolensis]|uniref:DUF547 domain-containing protein n=1 Tax=Hellea balneolensis TaxID=287478 RepID=UPI000406B8E2|nr:DUF547 domain-containing protein [Hellea balneolensis]